MGIDAGNVPKAERRADIGAESGSGDDGNGRVAPGTVDDAGATVSIAGSRDDTPIVNGASAPRSEAATSANEVDFARFGNSAETTGLIVRNKPDSEPPRVPG